MCWNEGTTSVAVAVAGVERSGRCTDGVRSIAAVQAGRAVGRAELLCHRTGTVAGKDRQGNPWREPGDSVGTIR